MNGERRQTRLGIAGLVLAAVVVFGPAIRTPWLWDDLPLIVQSPVLNQPRLLGQALLQDFWTISANPRTQGMYRPVVTASYFADRALFGTGPVGPHVVNLLLHLLAAALLARLAWRLGAAPLEALLVAALFGFHPVVVEAITNVSSRGDLLATSLLLSAFLLMRRPGTPALLLAAGLVALAQLSKEAAMVALPLALLLEWVAAGFRVDARRFVAVSLSLGLVTFLVLALRTWVLGSPVRLSSEADWTPVLSGATGLLRYGSRLAWPSPLVPYQPPTGSSWWALLGLAAIPAVVMLGLRRAPWLVLGVGWLVVATAPVAGWLPAQVRFSGLLLYLPLVGVALAGARALQKVRPAIQWLIPAAGALMCVLLVQMWSSGLSLWRANVEAFPGLVAPRLNLANALADAGEVERAREAYLGTVVAAGEAGDPKSLALAQLGLGNLLLPQQPQEAERHFREAVATSDQRLWQAALNLALALARQGKTAEAEGVLEDQWARVSHPAIAEAGVQLARHQGAHALEQKWRARLALSPAGSAGGQWRR